MRQKGIECKNEGDYDSAVEYFIKAAENGDSDAHLQLGGMYYDGELGVEKDDGKAVYHWEKAAIGGHPTARDTLLHSMRRTMVTWKEL